MKMNLYDLDQRIDELRDALGTGELLIDDDTGELIGVEEALDKLEMERTEKIENVGCWVKELTALAGSIRAEVKNMEERARAAEKKADALKGWLMTANTGEDGNPRRFQTAKVDIRFRNNAPSLRITSLEAIPKKFVDVKAVETVCNERVKKALLSGESVPGAELTRTRSVTVR